MGSIGTGTSTVAQYGAETLHGQTNSLGVPATTSLTGQLKRICSCESTGSPNNEPIQYNSDGTVLRGTINSHDIGACQINEDSWLSESRRLGYDIYTTDGNFKMALYIYNSLGTGPWTWSNACWQQTVDITHKQ